MRCSRFRANEHRLIKTCLESLHVLKPRLPHQSHKCLYTNGIVGGPQHMGDSMPATPVLNTIQCQFIERTAKFLDLKQQIARITLNT